VSSACHPLRIILANRQGLFVIIGKIAAVEPATRHQGHKNRPNFPKFGENRRNRAGPNSKTAKILFTISKFQKKIKVRKNM
jgi:hypothetical protein